MKNILMAVIHWVIGVTITAALIWLVEVLIGWRAVWDSWQLAPSLVVLQSLFLFALSHALRAWRIYLFKSHSLGLGYGLTLKLSLIHQSLNNLLPMRLGEASYPLLMKRYSALSLIDASLDLIWLRVLDLIVMASLSIFIAISYVCLELAIATALMTTAAGGYVLVLARSLSDRAGMPDEERGGLISALSRLGARGPISTTELYWLLCLTASAWAVKIGAIALLAAALTDLSWLTVLGGIVAGELSGVLPVHGVAGAGTYEAAFVAGAISGGDTLEKLLLTSVSLHIFVISSTCALTFMSLPLGRAPRKN